MDQLLDQLLQYLRGIWLRRFWGLAVAWLVGVAGLVYALVTPSQYQASARIFVDTESVLKPLMAGLTVQANTSQQVKMLANTLLSRPNVARLVEIAQLDDAGQDQNALIDRVTRRVELTGSEAKENLYSLSYRDTEPARAKRVVEALVSLFVESGLSNKRDTGKALAFLDEQIGEYEVVLRAAEQRLKEFKLQNLDRLASSQDSVGNMLAMDGEIEKARTELRAAEQRREALRRQLAGEQPMFLSDATGRPGGSAGSTDRLTEIDSRADALRRNLDELLRRYTDAHPDVVGTRRILAELDEQREAEVAERLRAGPNAPITGSGRREPNVVYQQLKVTLAEAEANVAALGARLSDLENRYNRIRAAARLKPEFEEELGQLNRDYQIQKTNFEQLVQRREQAKLTGQLDESGSVTFKVIDPPRVSPNPVAPDRLLLIMAVVAMSLGAGVATSFVVSQLFPTVSTVKDLRGVAELSVLGSISFRPTPAVLRRLKRNHYAFAGGLTGLCALFAVALAMFFAGIGMR